jgi:hypothetical protein
MCVQFVIYKEIQLGHLLGQLSMNLMDIPCFGNQIKGLAIL